MATHRNKEVVQHAFDALNDRDREAFTESHAADAALHADDEELRGVDALADAEFAFFDSFSDLQLTLESIIAEDDMVAARWTISGTHDGEFRGTAPTGVHVEYSAMGFFRVEDGVVTDVWLAADDLELYQQLGIVDTPIT